MKKFPHHFGWRGEQEGPQFPISDYSLKSLNRDNSCVVLKDKELIDGERKGILRSFFKIFSKFKEKKEIR